MTVSSTPSPGSRGRGARPRAQPGPELAAPPPGLRPDEERWLFARASQAGGLAAAWCGLVELMILYEACAVLTAGCEHVRRRGRRAGWSTARTERAVERWSQQRAAWWLRERLMNMLHGTRPGLPGGYGRTRLDDPAEPLPRATWRQLIAEGRTFVESRVPNAPARYAAGAGVRALRLPGLSSEKQRWLRQRSALLGGLDSALRFLVRATMRGVEASLAWRAQAQATAGGPDCRPHAVRMPPA